MAARALLEVLERDPLVVAVHAPPLVVAQDEGAEAVAVQSAVPEHPVVGETHQDVGRHHHPGGAPGERLAERLVERGIGRRGVRDLGGRVGEAHLDPLVGDHAAHPAHDLLGIVSVQHAAVEVGDRLRRDHVALLAPLEHGDREGGPQHRGVPATGQEGAAETVVAQRALEIVVASPRQSDRKSTRLNSSHLGISYAVFFLKKKKVWPVGNLIFTLIRILSPLYYPVSRLTPVWREIAQLIQSTYSDLLIEALTGLDTSPELS